MGALGQRFELGADPVGLRPGLILAAPGGRESPGQRAGRMGAVGRLQGADPCSRPVASGTLRPVQTLSDPEFDAALPEVALEARGNAVVVWEQDTGAGSKYLIHAAHFKAA